MNILVTGANGQLGNEMRIISHQSEDKYIFTDVNQVEGLETTYLDITDLDAVRKIVAENDVKAIVNCAAWTNVDGAEDPEKYALVEKLNATAPENLAKAMKEVDGWLVQISTDYVFGKEPYNFCPFAYAVLFARTSRSVAVASLVFVSDSIPEIYSSGNEI